MRRNRMFWLFISRACTCRNPLHLLERMLGTFALDRISGQRAGTHKQESEVWANVLWVKYRTGCRPRKLFVTKQIDFETNKTLQEVWEERWDHRFGEGTFPQPKLWSFPFVIPRKFHDKFVYVNNACLLVSCAVEWLPSICWKDT